MKAFGFTLIKTESLDSIRDRLKAVEDAQGGFNARSAKQTDAQISVFSRMETRLSMMEALHGVRFEAFDINDLSKSGQGRYVKIKAPELINLKKKFTNGFKAIEKIIKTERHSFKKWGIKKK